MKEIYTKIEINCSHEAVWRLLTGLNSYSKWNPVIKSVKGNLKVGENLRVEKNGFYCQVILGCLKTPKSCHSEERRICLFS
ncbi:MAG: hypothetical protein JEY94_10015 [Melioribacteraceae bacterium]|nr:hypothetical protein [Melioribacteraceae bacterium]